MKLGEKILHLRKAKGLSQEQLAAEISVSRQAISKWELGESMPDIENILHLTKIFDVTSDYLLNDTIDNPTNNQRETEENLVFKMLKDELKDDSDKLAFKSYQQKNQQAKWSTSWLSILGLLIIGVFICVYYFLFR